MLNQTDLYCFSPTGGTKKVGYEFAQAVSKKVNFIDLAGDCSGSTKSDLAVIAVPVFGGRIPAINSEKIRSLQGMGKKAVTLVVYGNRAYEDALLELNNSAKESGFEIVASGAFIAQHSIVPEVGQGRPDAKDKEEIRAFAQKVMERMESGIKKEIIVPGNVPYKAEMKRLATPISLSSCSLCEKCAAVCPVDAIHIQETVVTNPEKCILCMACTSVCPEHARVLPDALREGTEKMLSVFKTVRRENETFL